MAEYSRFQEIKDIPRLPLEASIDLTYRCNNNCRHCWVRISPDAEERQRELSLDDIKSIVDEARQMGCRKWSMSGGEPMLRPDFPEIFDYITSKAISYSLNTNGTMITPEIAELMRRKGRKMVALYGATAKIHDHITRTPGSFEAVMRGFEFLRDAGVQFIVQLIPMRDNYHQFREMIVLAKTLSPDWRLGAAWLYFSAIGDLERNAEINRQRLDPRLVVELDKPDPSEKEWEDGELEEVFPYSKDDRLFASCIDQRRKIHINPYGEACFCQYIRARELLYDLRNGSFQEAWERFVPSLAAKVKGGDEYSKNCGSCEYRADCRWCPVYGYLEHGRFSAPVEYLCRVTEETRSFKEDWAKNHRRYFNCAGITIQVDSDLPMSEETFHPTFKLFQTEVPGEDMITIRQHSELPHLDGKDLGEVVCQKGGWTIRRKGTSWIYLFSPRQGVKGRKIAVFNQDHTSVRLYSNGSMEMGQTDRASLYSDQIALIQTALAQVLAGRQGCFLHSSGVVFGGKGVLFVGHSGVGKSTLKEMILSRTKADSLCEDRNIVRRWPDGSWVYGTWANKDLPEVSATSAPLGAIMFVEQTEENRITPLEDRLEVVKRLIPCMIRPFETKEWWDNALTLLGNIAREVPCYRLGFDLSGEIVSMVESVCFGQG
jgi:MoaA/NifB/PqqE/SkfB family radical SAM enzyme